MALWLALVTLLAAPPALDRSYSGPTEAAGQESVEGEASPPTSSADASAAPDPRAEPTAPAEKVAPPAVGLSPGPTRPAHVAAGPRHRLIYDNLTAVRVNPIGFINDFGVGYRLQLFTREAAILRDTFLVTKAHLALNGAFARFGPLVEIQPVSFLRLSASYDFIGYFGSFDQLIGFETPTDDYHDRRLDQLDARGESRATFGHIATLAATLHGQVGPVFLRNTFSGIFADLRLDGDDRVFYDRQLDILHPDGGWVFHNETDAAWMFESGLNLGARNTLTHALYDREHFLPREPTSEPNSPMVRVGPLLSYQLWDAPRNRVAKPTVTFVLQWWARHRYRSGLEGTTAIPYAMLSFSFAGDLLPRR